MGIKHMNAEKTKIHKLRPLPHLPMVRDAYCSQEMTDKIIDYLVECHADRMLLLANEEPVIRITMFYKRLSEVVAMATKYGSDHGVKVPESLMGLHDLAYEISRRIRKAYDLPEIKAQGVPFAPSIEGPFPKLPHVEIHKRIKDEGFTQDMVDQVLMESYKERPDLWFIYSEAIRSNIRLYVIDEAIHKLFEHIIGQLAIELPKTYGSPIQTFMGEAQRRIQEICRIGELEMKKAIQPHNVM